MLNILADSFIRASYQDRYPKPRWDMLAHWFEPHHYTPKPPQRSRTMIDPIVSLAPQIAKNCSQGTCRVGPAYCCQRLTKRR